MIKKKPSKIIKVFQDFFQSTASGSIVLISFTILSMIWVNSNYGNSYHTLWDTPHTYNILEFIINFNLHQFVNDGLMVVFFFLVGIEIKRELVVGEISEFKKAMLPLIGALGGVLVPALIYTLFNYNRSSINGWAIPMATDIAFALGVLALLGNKVPIGLKVFLTALAIIDDLAAILVIAIFYTASLNVLSLFFAALIIAFMIVLNLMNIQKPIVYIFIGIILWFAILQSGIHSTIAGVVTALLIPIKKSNKRKNNEEDEKSFPIDKIEHKLALLVSFFIIPIFALVNSGIELHNFSFSNFQNSISIGIFLGLIIGKPLGVFTFVWLSVKYKFASLPKDLNLKEMLGVSILCGIGFTMSIFVSNLSFELGSSDLNLAKTSILFASTISAILGFLYLHFSLRKKNIS